MEMRRYISNACFPKSFFSRSVVEKGIQFPSFSLRRSFSNEKKFVVFWYIGRAGNKTVFLAETRGCVPRLPVHTFGSFVSFSVRVPNVERITKRK